MMIRFLHNKKAVSPLIATVLLIAFAVALGAVVMNWGRGYVEDTQQFARERSDAEVTCTTEIDLNVISIDLVQQVCYNSTDQNVGEWNVTIILENAGSREIDDIQGRVISTGSRIPYAPFINVSIDAGRAKLITFIHNESDFGGIAQIALSPIIRLGGKEIVCSGSQLKLIDIQSCNEVFG